MNDIKIRIEDVDINYECVTAQLWLTDDEYKEIVGRTNLIEDLKTTYEEVRNVESDNYINIDIYIEYLRNGKIKGVLYARSEDVIDILEDNCYSFEFTENEKEQIIIELAEEIDEMLNG